MIINYDGGGVIAQYEQRADNLAQSGERVEVRGYCMSACTIMVLDPRVKACVTPNAALGFHKGSAPIGDWNRWRFSIPYPQPWAGWIAENGGLPERGFLIITGEEILKRSWLPPC